MSLSYGGGPFGTAPVGRFNFTPAPPGRAIYAEPVPYRVRALVGGAAVLDTERAIMLHETGHLPVFYAPLEDFRADLLVPSTTSTHCPYKGDAGYHDVVVGERRIADAVWRYAAPLPTVPWLAPLAALRFAAADRWLCEDAELVGHPRDPYHRIDVLPTGREVVVSRDGAELARSRRALLVVEAALPRRLYLPADDLRAELLEDSPTTTVCAYKGTARYRSARVAGRLVADVAWSYPAPAPELRALAGRWCFFDEHVDVDLDGVRQERPVSAWSGRAQGSGDG